MPKTYTKPVCRGSYALGTACGVCERCEEERRGVVYPAADTSMADLSAALAAIPMPSSPLAELRELRWNSTEGPWTFDANCAGHILAGGSPIVTVRSHADAELIVGVVAYLDKLLAGNGEQPGQPAPDRLEAIKECIFALPASRDTGGFRNDEVEGWNAAIAESVEQLTALLDPVPAREMYTFDEWCIDDDSWNQETGAPGIALFGRALSVWTWMQQRPTSVADAAKAFNVDPLRVVQAVDEGYHWMYLAGPRDDFGLLMIEHDGE